MKKTMKKCYFFKLFASQKIITILLLISVISLAGCGRQSDKTATAESDVLSAEDIEKDLSDIETLEEDTELSELDSLEEDLDELI